MYDLIIRFHASTNIGESIDICEQFEKLRIYSNTNLDYISKKYKSVSISIHDDWKIGKLENWKIGKLENWKSGNKIDTVAK